MSEITRKIKVEKQRTFLNRDFDSFRAELVRYAKSYFNKSISDFSEASVGGMLVELAAYVGDVLSFYLDHQFSELDLQTAVEDINVERLIRSSGVRIAGASPATVDADFFIEVEAETLATITQPRQGVLPIIRQGTILLSVTGITYELMHDINFKETNSSGLLLASFQGVPGSQDSEGNFSLFALKRSGKCTSGKTTIDTFAIDRNFMPFRTITLRSGNISEIISVIDSDGNEFYEVDALTQDTVYKRVINLHSDRSEVPENLELILAPRRFVSGYDRQTGLTTLRFGSGRAISLDTDVVPDPSEFAIPLYGDRKTFHRFTIDPNSMLTTKTMGISPVNTVISVRYRYGGGLSHNVPANALSVVRTLLMDFPAGTPASIISSVRGSCEAANPFDAVGGENALTLNEYRAAAFSARNQQNRIVTKEDLIARVYTMPSNFGRVFRIGVRSNPLNPLASLVSIVSRDRNGQLVVSPDTLKLNLKNYLNEFRIVSDAIDIIDASIVNLGIQYAVVVNAISNETLVLQNINSKLSKFLKIENFQIDQPLVKTDLMNLIINTPGVLSLVEVHVVNKIGTEDGIRVYSGTSLNVEGSTINQIVFPPLGGIFEVRYPSFDIVGSTI